MILKKKYLIIILSFILAITIVRYGTVVFNRWHNGGQGVTNISMNDRAIQTSTDLVRLQPDNQDAYISLAYAYIQKLRETADISYYDKILALMDQAEKINKDNPEFANIRASVFAGQHDFKRALAFAQKAVTSNPNLARYYGILTDAQIELGQYDAATKSLQKMIDLRPDFTSFTRISHLRELYGDITGSEIAMKSAIDSGAGFPENIAWARVELGKLYFTHDMALAEREFNHALYLLPDYPRALQWLGHVAFARGNKEEAKQYFEKAFTLLPLAEHATNLGDIYSILGDKEKANQYYKVVQIGYNDFAAKGTNVDLESALFLTDHDIDLTEALVQARRVYADRPSIYSADILAWALYKNNNLTEAQKYSNIALKLKTHDASLYFHAGIIAKALKQNGLAKANFEKILLYNPNFSILFAGQARYMLDN